MPQTQVKVPATGPAGRWRRFLSRLLTIAAVGTVMVWVIHHSSSGLDRNLEPAGFGRGLLHGALMPMAMPNLIVGQDVPIYTPNNQGRLYKLGYTMGVNGCGALFFGICFWRLTRWRKQRTLANTPPAAE